MRMKVILLSMMFLMAHTAFAERHCLRMYYQHRNLSGKTTRPNRAPMRIPIDVVYDSDANMLEIKGPESLQAEIYIYDMSGALENYSAILNTDFYALKPGAHVILIKGDGWEAEGTLELQ